MKNRSEDRSQQSESYHQWLTSLWTFAILANLMNRVSSRPFVVYQQSIR